MVGEVEPKGAGKRDLPDDETPSGRSKLRKLTGKLSLDSVPPEIIARIATFQRLGADNPRKVTEAATNFSQVRQNFRNATAGYPETREAVDGSIVRTGQVLGGSPALQLFDRRVKRLGSLATRIFDDIIPEGRLPDVEPGGTPRYERMSDPLAARDLVDATGPILGYQKKEKTRALIDEIKHFQLEEAGAETLHALARNSQHLSEEERHAIAAQAIVIVQTNDGQPFPSNIDAADALVRLENHGHLSDRARLDLELVIESHPAIGALLEDERENLSGQDEHMEEDAPEIVNIDKHITELGELREYLSQEPLPDEHEQLSSQQELVEKIPKLHNLARAELIRSLRDDHVR
jgi:hypothetical protein